MSVEVVQAIIARAMAEPEYRRRLFSDPDRALQGYNVTDEERRVIRHLSPDAFHTAVGRQTAHHLLPMRYGRRLQVVPHWPGSLPRPDAGTILLDQSRTRARVLIETGQPVTEREVGARVSNRQRKDADMSLQNVQTIIGWAIMEPTFCRLLFSDPDEALKGYDLTREEVKDRKSLDASSLDAVEDELKTRMSKASSGRAVWLDEETLRALGFVSTLQTGPGMVK